LSKLTLLANELSFQEALTLIAKHCTFSGSRVFNFNPDYHLIVMVQ